jgi:hypothetical protein
MASVTFAGYMIDWDDLIVKVRANLADLPHLEGYLMELEKERVEAKAARDRQLTLQADAQQATRNLQDSLKRGNDLAVRMRGGIRSKYGNTSEKLADFGMQPRRKRKSTKEKPTPEGEKKPAPSTAAADGESQ